VRDEQEHLARERAAEAAARLDRRADDDELGSALRGDACDVLAEPAGARADELPPHADAVRVRHRGGAFEPLLQVGELSVEVGVQRQLVLEDGRGDEHDPGPAVGREPAREIERVLGLLPLEQGHDDAPVGDRAGPAREAACPAVKQPDVGRPHRRSG
jgi:hypothetical protein